MTYSIALLIGFGKLLSKHFIILYESWREIHYFGVPPQTVSEVADIVATVAKMGVKKWIDRVLGEIWQKENILICFKRPKV